MLATAVMVVLGVATGGLLVIVLGSPADPGITVSSGDGPFGARAAGSAAESVSASDLDAIRRTRVFFGHQSVGDNILDGIRAVYTENGSDPLTVVDGRHPPGTEGGFVLETAIGDNGDPVGKIADFDTVMRSGLAEHIDVAVMKLCYIDIAPGTDVHEVFDTYSSTMAALEKDFPTVTFVKTTVPITAQPSGIDQVKQRIRGQGSYGLGANAARQRLNALIRAAYADDHLLDIAAAESRTPEGTRVGGTYGDDPYYALYSGYALDEGHLNEEGSVRVATAWLAAVAGAAAGRP
jgi:hypothetical protein